jgi:hypothetical protein
VNQFTREPVTVAPKGTFRTSCAPRIVYCFLVRTPDDSVGHYDGDNLVFQQEGLNLSASLFVRTNVTVVGVPSFQDVSSAAFVSHNANRDLRRMTIVWTIESNRGDWITTKALLGFLEQRVLGS